MAAFGGGSIEPAEHGSVRALLRIRAVKYDVGTLNQPSAVLTPSALIEAEVDARAQAFDVHLPFMLIP